MRLARYTHVDRTTWGFVEDDGVRSVPDGTPPFLDLIRAGGLAAVAAVRPLSAPPVPLGTVELLAPVERPGKIVCVGLNYREHALESGFSLPTEPLIFMKFPSSITGPTDHIVLPRESSQVDWEVELAVLIGSHAQNVEPEAAHEHVAGYLVANDVSARDLQSRDVQWVRAKSYTSFCPLGPWVATADEVGDGSGLDISLSVNGEVRQNSTTSDLVFDVAHIVSYISAISALEPGDLILTGTPAGTGVGLNPQQFLHPGDVVRASITGLGELVNPVVVAD